MPEDAFFRLLEGMVKQGVTADHAASIAADLAKHSKVAPRSQSSRRSSKSTPKSGGASEAEFQEILSSIQWPKNFKEALAEGIANTGISSGRLRFKLMALIKQGRLVKSEDKTYAPPSSEL